MLLSRIMLILTAGTLIGGCLAEPMASWDAWYCDAWGGKPAVKAPDDFDESPKACGACGRTCALPGVAEHACRIGICRAVRCAPGYFDVDEDAENGCECRGEAAERCVACDAAEVGFDGLDNDCDLRVDEQVEPRYEVAMGEAGYDPHVDGVIIRRPERTRRPNGELGEYDFWGKELITRAAPTSRAHCGAAEAACEGDGNHDVDCRPAGDGVPVCRRAWLTDRYVPPAPLPEVDAVELPREDDGKPGAEPEPAGRYKIRDTCGDGIDDDRNGVVDDGFDCRTLVPAVARTKCQGRTPSHGCPATMVALPDVFPAPPLAPGETAGPVAYMTRDVWFDLYEANEAQFQRFLRATGRCDAEDVDRHPLCDAVVDGAAALPATGLNWCEAYDYCQWAGKRLPTEVEWLRAFGAEGLYTRVNSAGPCEGEAPPQSAECGGVGVASTTRLAGAVVRGTAVRKTTSANVFGNVAEWLFDAAVDPCELPWVGCVGGVPAYAKAIPVDPVWTPAEPDVMRMRLLRGGGWDSEAGALGRDGRLFALPGVPGHHYGVRCAQSADPADAGWAPYEDEWESTRHASCGAFPRPARVARRSGGRALARAVDACFVENDAVGMEGWQLNAVARIVADSVRPLLLQLDGASGVEPTLRVEVGLDPGSEAFWLRGAEPGPIAAPGCSLDDCRFVAASAELHPARRNFGVVPLALLAGRTLSVSEQRGASCLGPTSTTAVHWRFEVTLAATDAERLFDRSDAAEAACARFTCVEPVEPASCATTCPGWHLTLDVALERLIAP